MPDFEDIRRGLAANLTALRDSGFHVFCYLLDDPKPPAIQVAGAKEIAYATFGHPGSDELNLVVEAALAKSTDVGPQKLLDKLLAPSGDGSLRAAVEADPSLSSRLLDDGTVASAQGAACDACALLRYLGSAPFTLPRNGTEVLLASWEVKVLT